MVQTIAPVVHGGKRFRWQMAVALHTAGATLGAAALGGGLGAGGWILGAPWGRLGSLVVASLALLYALREAFGVPVPIPNRGRQVPEWWRSYLSPNATAFVYGAGLGVGFFTFLRHGTLVAVAAVAVASGDPVAGAAVMAPFGVARGLSVSVGRNGTSAERIQRVVDRLAAVARRHLLNSINATVLLLLGLDAVLAPTVERKGAHGLAVWVLVVVFGWAAMSKLMSPGRWREVLSAYRLPKELELLARPAVPVFEAAVAVLAISGRARWSGGLALVLLTAFTIAVLTVRRAEGNRVPCGCFGGSRRRDYRALLLRNLALVVLGVMIVAADVETSITEGFRAPHTGEALPALLVVLGIGLGISTLRRLVVLRQAAME